MSDHICTLLHSSRRLLGAPCRRPTLRRSSSSEPPQLPALTPDRVPHPADALLPLQLTKALAKKLKLGKDAAEALTTRLIEAQMAFDLQNKSQLPVKLDEKLGKAHELLTLADERLFSKASVEDLLAYLSSVSAAELASVRRSLIRWLHLRHWLCSL
jgi:hypothetical protein